MPANNHTTSFKSCSGVYSITNTRNGKMYIGSAVNIPKRWSGHRLDLTKGKHHSQYLQRAWNKYGAEAFMFSIIEVVIDPSRLLEREQFHLNETKAYDHCHGYNVNPTAGSRLGRTWSEETRKKMAARQILPPSEEARAKMAAAKLGKARKPFSEEHKQKLAAAWVGRTPKPMSSETKAKLSAAKRGHPLSAEHMAKLQAGRRAQPCGPMSGKKHSAEAKAKIAAAKLGKHRSKLLSKGQLSLGFDE